MRQFWAWNQQGTLGVLSMIFKSNRLMTNLPLIRLSSYQHGQKKDIEKDRWKEKVSAPPLTFKFANSSFTQ
jgi:hypothetical protein